MDESVRIAIRLMTSVWAMALIGLAGLVLSVLLFGVRRAIRILFVSAVIFLGLAAVAWWLQR